MVALQPDRKAGTRHRVLRRDDALQIKLSYYPPSLSQSPHGHDRGQVSFLLSGRLREQNGAAEVEVFSGSAGRRSGGSRHGVDYGPEGALILNIAAEWAAADVRGGAIWSPAASRRLLPLLMARPDDDDVLEDLRASLQSPGVRDASGPPAWFRQARARFSEAPGDLTVGMLAAELGLHRVYFARAFERWSGMQPSAFRIGRMVDRGLAAILAGVPAAQAAVDAGFADQSHMSRALKALTGVPPARLASLLA